MEPPVVHLKSGEDDRLRRGHPWLFRGEIDRVDGPHEPGALARLRSSTFEDLGWGHLNEHSKIAFRWLAWHGPIDKAFYLDKLKKALELRKRLFPGEDAYRLCFGESDGLPGLVVDRYGRHLSVQLLSAGMDRDWPMIQRALLELITPEGIQLRNDSELRKSEGLPPGANVSWGHVPSEVEIRSGTLKFIVPLGSGQKTGFYFDQRRNREFAASYCSDKRVLDLYCYAGAFALEAGKAGARLALGVDSSAQAVDVASRNAKLNGLDNRVHFEKGDAEQFLKELSAQPAGERPEVVFIDPPNYAHHKAALENARYAYSRLFARGFKCLPKGGLLGVSTCSSFVTAPLFRKIVEHAARTAKRRIEPIAFRGQSDDHPVLAVMPETEYLHFGLVRVVE
jgi:23S rRNA (cytosine1962-C5)-methyltransferase